MATHDGSDVCDAQYEDAPTTESDPEQATNKAGTERDDNVTQRTNQNLASSRNTHHNTTLASLQESEALVEDLDNADDAEVQSKVVSLVLDLAKPFAHSYRTITMDNYYTSIKTLCELYCIGIFA